MTERFMRELRCEKCRRLLFKEYIFDGHVEIKCSACGFVKKYNFKYYKNLKKKDDTIGLDEGAIDSQ